VSRLTLVPTPIGALHDITQHAIEVLSQADVIAAEDTRRSGQLLAHHGIDTPLVRLDAHTIPTRATQVLQEHGHVAYVSDAGTPGISDPGADLVRIALDAGHEVEALPGPTAFVPALVLAGFPVARFTFEGFLPRKGSGRNGRLRAIADRTHPSAIYEAANRMAGTLQDLASVCGEDRQASVSRELSKRFEETRRGTLGELIAWATETPPKGECVLVLQGAPEPDARVGGAARMLQVQAADAAERLAATGLQGKPLRDALQALGIPRNEAYELAMAQSEPA